MAEKAAVAEPGPTGVSLTDPTFWQLLLAGELSARKARLIVRELIDDPRRVEALLAHPSLADGERRRIAAASREVCADLVLAQEFPEPLAESEGPPAIFVRGDAATLHVPCVAIVGTRDASPYGKACAQKFAEGLARAGVTVVSGGALGIDASAHQGALNAGGRTAAVLAGGVDTVYPAVHAGLFTRIVESGCLVSQFACGVRPGEHKFLLRNDLIAALSLAVVVIEAPPKSGALRTASTAAELGREVFVVPATIERRAYWGSFNLLRDGATLVYHPDQILESLGIDPTPAIVESKPEGDAERILAALTIDPIDPEKIVDRTGLDASVVLSELTMLEIDGRIVRHAGGYAIKP